MSRQGVKKLCSFDEIATFVSEIGMDVLLPILFKQLLANDRTFIYTLFMPHETLFSHGTSLLYSHQQGCGAVTFLVGSGSGSGSGEAIRLQLRLRLRVKLFCGSGSGSGSGQNVPAPAAPAPAPAPMIKSSYEP